MLQCFGEGGVSRSFGEEGVSRCSLCTPALFQPCPAAPPYTLHPLTLPSSAQAWLRERPSLHDPPIPPLPPRTRVGAYGRLGLAELFEMREECLREFGFNDVYRQAGTGGGRGGSERLEAAAVAIAQAQLVVMSSGPGPTCRCNASTLTLQVNLTTNHVFFLPLPPLQAG